MYVAVKGGERAILASHEAVAAARRGSLEVPEMTVTQIREQLGLAVDRVMAEGALYDPDLAALAIKQSRGDLLEAIHLLRAYRTTLPRLGFSAPIDTGRMAVRRRISATFKDVPGGQILGPTFDYTHRLLDFSLAAEGARPDQAHRHSLSTPAGDQHVGKSGNGNGANGTATPMPRILDVLHGEGLVEREREDDEAQPVADLTREPLTLPAERDARLQNLARADEGFLLGLGYSTQRGYGRNHPFAGEIRMGEVALEIVPEELGFAIDIGDLTVTECQMVNQFHGSKEVPPQFTRGYGLSFGYCERKTMAMALVDRALRGRELGEPVAAPAQDQEFVLYHSDALEAAGFVQHLKLPHYIDFQAELELVRRMRAEAAAASPVAVGSAGAASARTTSAQVTASAGESR